MSVSRALRPLAALSLLIASGCEDRLLAPPDRADTEAGVGRVRVLDPAALESGVLLERDVPFRSLLLAAAADPDARFELRVAGGDWRPVVFDEVIDDVRTGVVALGQAARSVELRADGHVTFAQVEPHTGAVPVFDDDLGAVGEEFGRAIAGWWEPTPDAWAAGQSQYLPYASADHCTGGARPGAVVLADWLRANFAASSYGIYNCRAIAGSSAMSVHSEGRAIDLFVPVDGGAAYPSNADNDAGDPITHFLMANAEAIGISYLVWDRGSWGAHRSGDKHSYYSGVHPHNDHLHIELTRDAAEVLGVGTLDGLVAEPTNDWIALAAAPDGDGYWLAREDGSVGAFGGAPWVGDLLGLGIAAPVVDAVADPGGGLWLASADGGVFTLGGASFHGSLGGQPLNGRVVGMAGTPSGGGYWLVAEDGGVFTFGDAPFFGSMGGQPLNAPIVGVAAAPQGDGYWLVAEDGGVFTFGGVGFHGSTGGLALTAPVTGMSSSATGGGYWLVAEDGGVFSFGDAAFHGSMGGSAMAAPVADLARGTSGYWMLGRDGGVFSFDVPFYGSVP
jgi:hypothetical protein